MMLSTDHVIGLNHLHHLCQLLCRMALNSILCDCMVECVVLNEISQIRQVLCNLLDSINMFSSSCYDEVSIRDDIFKSIIFATLHSLLLSVNL